MSKKIRRVLILTLAVTMLSGNSFDIRAAAYHESRLSLYGMTNGEEVRLSVNAKGQLQVIIKNGMDKKGNEYNGKIVYKKKGKKVGITKIRKNSKRIFADGYTTITRGERIYNIKIKGSKALLSMYNKKGKKKKTQKFDCSKIKKKYKKMKVAQMLFVSKNKLRILYGNTDKIGVPYDGGSIILNLSTGKAKREATFSFMPEGYSKGKVYAVPGSHILVAEVKNGKNIASFQLPPGDSVVHNAVSYRNGILLYVNKNGAYMAKDTDKELRLVHSFSKSRMKTKYVRCAAVASKKCFYVGFASSEEGEPKDIVKYSC